ncbi:tubulin-specific chaperone A [Haematococcus lacustris]|uniref:Tubulin-specific chaperone A n=1 Tax=Haematococcus lacustris TaxID=44745 RepID=A0A699ZT12_HAELA|nr:tubulin-specific chaperone A [Haematococcus lacustris]
MSQAEVIKVLKVKTAGVKRTQKELFMYEKDRDKEQGRVDRLKADGADSHDIKHAENVLAEAAMMIPETRQRLATAFSDLQSYMADNATDIPAESEELAAAKEIIAAVESLFKT